MIRFFESQFKGYLFYGSTLEEKHLRSFNNLIPNQLPHRNVESFLNFTGKCFNTHVGLICIKRGGMVPGVMNLNKIQQILNEGVAIFQTEMIPEFQWG